MFYFQVCFKQYKVKTQVETNLEKDAGKVFWQVKGIKKRMY